MAKQLRPSQLEELLSGDLNGNEFFVLHRIGYNYSLTLGELKKYIGTGGSGTGSDIDLTSVPSNIIPDSNGSRILGNQENAWRRLFLTDSIRFTSNGIIYGDVDVQGALTLNGQALAMQSSIDRNTSIINDIDDRLAKVESSSSVDLSDYYTKQNVDDILNNYTTTSVLQSDYVSVRGDNTITGTHTYNDGKLKVGQYAFGASSSGITIDGGVIQTSLNSYTNSEIDDKIAAEATSVQSWVSNNFLTNTGGTINGNLSINGKVNLVNGFETNVTSYIGGHEILTSNSLKIGEYAFQDRTENRLSSTTDLNNVSYGVWGTLDNTTYTNAPIQNFGLIVSRLNQLYKGQLILPYSNGHLQYRAQLYNNGNIKWSGWRSLAFTDDLTNYIKDGDTINALAMTTLQIGFNTITADGTKLVTSGPLYVKGELTALSLDRSTYSQVATHEDLGAYLTIKNSAGLMQNNGVISIDHIDLTTYTAGATGFTDEPNSGVYKVQRTGHSDTYLKFKGTGSTSSLEFLSNYSSGSRLKFRKIIDSNRVSGPWRELAFIDDIPSLEGYATMTDTINKINEIVADKVSGLPSYAGSLSGSQLQYLNMHENQANPAEITSKSAVYYIVDKQCFYIVSDPNIIGSAGAKTHAYSVFDGSAFYNSSTTSARKDCLFYNTTTKTVHRIGDSSVLTMLDSGNISSYNFATQQWADNRYLSKTDAIQFGSTATFKNAHALLWMDSSGSGAHSAMSVSASNQLCIGYGTSQSSMPTYIDGYAVYLRYGTAHTPGVKINSNGAVDVYSSLKVGNTSLGNGTSSIHIYRNSYDVPYIRFSAKNLQGVDYTCGEIGVHKDTGVPVYWNTVKNSTSWKSFITEDNIGDYALPINGGTINVDLNIAKNFSVDEIALLKKRLTIGSTSDLAGNNYVLYANGDTRLNGVVKIASSVEAGNITSGINYTYTVRPRTTDTYYLGVSDYRWKGAYINEAVIDTITATKLKVPSTTNNYAFVLEDSNGAIIRPNGTFRAYMGTSSNPFHEMHSNTFTQSSDATKKDIIGNTELTLSQIANAPAVNFTWKSGFDTTTKQVGTIAQYWKDVLPEVVSGEDGNMGINYATLGVVSAIILARNIETHEQRIARLEKEIASLTEELNSLIGKE